MRQDTLTFRSRTLADIVRLLEICESLRNDAAELRNRPPRWQYGIAARAGYRIKDHLSSTEIDKSPLAVLEPQQSTLAIPAAQYVEVDMRADYRYRVRLRRLFAEMLLARLLQDIDYSNFKADVSKKGLFNHARAYSRVWSAMRELQDNETAADNEADEAEWREADEAEWRAEARDEDDADIEARWPWDDDALSGGSLVDNARG